MEGKLFISKKIIIFLSLIIFLIVGVATVMNFDKISQKNIIKSGNENTVNIGNHLLTNRAKVLEIESENSVIVEILPRIVQGELHGETERKNEYTLVVGDTIKATFSKTNDRAISFTKELEIGSIINISRYDNTKVDFDHVPPKVDCTGIDIYDANGEKVIKYY